MKKATSKLKPRLMRLKKGLTRAEALRAALRKSPADFRGFRYDPQTGQATLI
jgi:hypothetical protein